MSVLLDPGEPDGFVTFSHAGDDWRVCRDHVKARLGLPIWHPGIQLHSPPPPIMSNLPSSEEASAKRAGAMKIWHESHDPRGTLVEVYLKSRCLPLSEEIAGSVLRFHPGTWCKWVQATVPAMISLFRDILTDEPKAIHRTFLRSDGTKIERKMLGSVGGAAIKIDADAEVTMGLTIGEGLETCLSARVAQFRPVWALGSAGAIGTFPVLPGIGGLTILGETDRTGANERAALSCGGRWLAAGAEVVLVKPKGGGDLNDVLREVAA